MSELPDHELRRLQAIASADRPLDLLIDLRLAGQPLQYLEGSAAFVSLDLLVDERVLIPRPETERLFEIAVSMVRSPTVIIDLCTGSGALALALKKEFPGASVFATDISPDAIDVAMMNRDISKLAIYLVQGDLFDPLPDSIMGSVDLIVANPPYVAQSEFASLPADVRREPKMALVAGVTGLEVVQRIGAEAARWLRPGGVIVCEIGERQGVSAPASFRDLPTVVRKDLAGRDRYVVSVKP